MALNLQFKLVTKDRLFYDRFEYSIGFHLDEVSCLRELDHGYIDTMIERRRAWKEVAQQRFAKSNNTFSNVIMTRRTKAITNETVENLHSLADLLLTTDADFKLVVSANQAWVYTNDQTLVKILGDLDYVTHRSYTRAVITRPKDTICLKNPQHQFRSYLRAVKLTDQQKNQLMAFLITQNDWIRISPALSGWLVTPFNRTQDYFFVDYSSATWLTMLSLVHPGLVRKTLEIIPYK